MTTDERGQLADALLKKTIALGADLAGLAPVSALRNGPSEQLFPRMKDHARDHFAERVTTGLPHGAVKWEEEEQTLLVFALSHPAERPELDWWVGEDDPPGNRMLMDIARKLKEAAEAMEPTLRVFLKPYHVEKGGIYLKDAAVAAGLGCIGRSNLLVTPQFGPRVRLRAVGLNLDLPGSGASTFDPCADCAAPCRSGCPQEAFARRIYTEKDGAFLPARDGSYYRLSCVMEMEKNEQEPGDTVRYCRACELRCPVGR